MADNLWDTTRTESAEHQPVGEGLLFAGYRAVLEGRPLDEACALAHMKGLVVLADIKSGTMAGFKSLAISGAERQWLLNPGLVHGEVRFVRYVTPQFYDFEMMHEVFLHEQAWVEVHVEEELDVDTIPLVLMHNQDVVHFNDREILVAHRDKNNRTLYRTAPLYIVPDDDPPGPRAGVQQIRVKAGDELLVAPAVNWFISPPTHRVQVWADPGTIHLQNGGIATWQEAIDHVSRIDNTKAQIRRVSSILLSIALPSPIAETAKPEFIFVPVKTYAAMLLLRDQFIESAMERRKELQLILSKDELVAGYGEILRAQGEAADGRPYPMGRLVLQNKGFPWKWTLEAACNPDFLEKLAPAWWHNSQAIRNAFLQSVAKDALESQISSLSEAITSASAIADDDPAGLLKLTGKNFDPIIQRLSSRLLRRVEFSDPDGTRWSGCTPDIEARQTVAHISADLEILETNYKAVHELRKAWLSGLDAISLGLSLTPEGLVARCILVRVSFAAFRAMVSAENLMATSVDASEWFEHEAEFKFARGATPILGWSRFDEAKARRQPGWVPVASIGFDLLGTCLDTFDLAAGLSLDRAYKLAPQVASILERAPGFGLKALTPSELRVFLATSEDARLALMATLDDIRLGKIATHRLSPIQQRMVKLADGIDGDFVIADALGRANVSIETRAAASVRVPTKEVEAAYLTARPGLQLLAERGIDAAQSLSPTEREAVATVLTDSRRAATNGRELTTAQHDSLHLAEQLEVEAASRGFEIPELPHDLVIDEELNVAAATKTHKVAPEPKPKEWMPPANSPFEPVPGRTPIELGHFVAGGEFSGVYHLLDASRQPTGRVVKIIRRPAWEPSTIQQILDRISHSNEIIAELAAKHPERRWLQCHRVYQVGDMGVVEMDFAQGATFVHGREDLTSDHFEAAIELGGLLVRDKVAWLDPNLTNMVYFKRGDALEAVPVDIDYFIREGEAAQSPDMAIRILNYERGFAHGVCSVDNFDANAVLDAMGTLPRQLSETKIRELLRANPAETTANLIREIDGWAFRQVRLENCERVMARWFEGSGAYRFDETPLREILAGGPRGQFRDGRISMATVRREFPNVDRFVTYGDTDLVRAAALRKAGAAPHVRDDPWHLLEPAVAARLETLRQRPDVSALVEQDAVGLNILVEQRGLDAVAAELQYGSHYTLGSLQLSLDRRASGVTGLEADIYREIDPIRAPGWELKHSTGRSGDAEMLSTTVRGPARDGIGVGEGKIIRTYDPARRVLTFSLADLEATKKPVQAWMRTGKAELVPGRGTPTVVYVTLAQMKMWGIPLGGVREFKWSTVVNLDSLFHLAWLRREFPDPKKVPWEELFRQTSSFRYGETIITQSGHAIDKLEFSGAGFERLGNMLAEARRKGDESELHELQSLMVRYGLDPETELFTSFDVTASVSPLPNLPPAVPPAEGLPPPSPRPRSPRRRGRDPRRFASAIARRGRMRRRFVCQAPSRPRPTSGRPSLKRGRRWRTGVPGL